MKFKFTPTKITSHITLTEDGDLLSCWGDTYSVKEIVHGPMIHTDDPYFWGNTPSAKTAELATAEMVRQAAQAIAKNPTEGKP